MFPHCSTKCLIHFAFNRIKDTTSTLGRLLDVNVDLFEAVHQLLVVGVAQLALAQDGLVAAVNGGVSAAHFIQIVQHPRVFCYGQEIVYSVDLTS